MLKNDIRPRCAPRFSGVLVLAGFAALVALQLVPLTVHASTDLALSDAAYARFRAVVTGNAATVSYGSTGAVLSSASSLPSVASVAGLSPTSGEVSRYGSFSTKYGQVPFKVAQTISVGKLATGVAAVATAATGGFAGIAISVAAPYVFDWLTDAGVTLSEDGVPRGSPYPPGETGAYQFKFCYTGYDPAKGGFYEACSSWGTRAATAEWARAEWGGSSITCDPYPASKCTMVRPGYSNQDIFLSTRANQEPAPPGPVLSSSDLGSALLASPRTASEIEKILSETIKYPEIQPDPVDWVRIDPVNPGDYIKSPTKTDQKTTTNPDGSKVEETKSCWVKGTVQTGASLKLTEVCNTDTVTKSPTGTVTGTTTATTDSETADAATPEKDGFCATLLGKLVCADMDTPDDEVPKKTENVDFDPEDLGFGDGQCPPPYAWTDSAGSHEIDLSPYCDKLTTVVKPLVILFSLLAAFFIVAPGKPDGGA